MTLVNTWCYKFDCMKRLGVVPENYKAGSYGMRVYCEEYPDGVPKEINSGTSCDLVEKRNDFKRQ